MQKNQISLKTVENLHITGKILGKALGRTAGKSHGN